MTSAKRTTRENILQVRGKCCALIHRSGRPRFTSERNITFLITSCNDGGCYETRALPSVFTQLMETRFTCVGCFTLRKDCARARENLLSSNYRACCLCTYFTLSTLMKNHTASAPSFVVAMPRRNRRRVSVFLKGKLGCLL